jgi:hypothetical protein
MHTNIKSKQLREIDHSEDLGVYGEIIVKFLKKQSVKALTRLL